MASIDDNLFHWNTSYDWSNRGDEWSQWWGGVEAQWYATILPRIHCFVPAGHILEIGPGFGRWTQMLCGLCESLSVVDVSPKCIAACTTRFRDLGKVASYLNDGRSLAMIKDGSVDFAFSFDSLVHAEADVLQQYVLQLGAKLSADGVGFIHHSNLACDEAKAGNPVTELFANEGWRAESMSAKAFDRFCTSAGLQCIGQELVPWGKTRRVTDCLSLFTRPRSRWARKLHVRVNPEFMLEAEYASRVFSGYTCSAMSPLPSVSGSGSSA